MGLNASRGCARKSIDIARPTDIISSIIYVVFSGNQFTAKEALYPLSCDSCFKQTCRQDEDPQKWLLEVDSNSFH